MFLPRCVHHFHASDNHACLVSSICLSLTFHFSLSCIGEGSGNPLQCSCLENPRDGGAWWAAIYGVATESDTTSDLAAAADQCLTLYGKEYVSFTLEEEMVTHCSSLAWRVP